MISILNKFRLPMTHFCYNKM